MIARILSGNLDSQIKPGMEDAVCSKDLFSTPENSIKPNSSREGEGNGKGGSDDSGSGGGEKSGSDPSRIDGNDGASNGTGIGNGGKEPPKAWWSLWKELGTSISKNIGTVVSAIVSTIAAVGGVYVFFYPRVKKKLQIYRALQTPLVFEPPNNYIERKELQEIIKQWRLSNTFRTLVVAGSRGVGKTTTVRSTFSGETGVLYYTMSESQTSKDVWRSLLGKLASEASLEDPVSQLTEFLVNNKRSGKKPPVIVIEITELMTGAELRRVLNVAKDLGGDSQLAKIVVVVSAELSSYEVGVAYGDLRCKIWYVPEATNDEAKKYFEKLFSTLPSTSGGLLFTKSDIGPMVEFALGKVDRRFLSFSSLLDLKSKYSTIEEVKRAISLNYSMEFNSYVNNFRVVLKALEVTEQSSPGFKLLQDLSNEEEINIRDLTYVYNVDEDAFFAANHKVKPHPFFFYVNTGKVKISSDMMAQSLRESLASVKN